MELNLFWEQIKGTFCRLQLIWADAAYSGQLVDWVKVVCGWFLEIVKRSDDVKGFKVLPHRSVLHQLDQKIIYPHYDFKHLTEKYFEIGMKLNDFSIQLVKYCRWIVERTFGWLGRYRRLSKDYEGLTESSQALIYAAMVHIMIRRLARIKTSSG